MARRRVEPITVLPPDYREVCYLSVNQRGMLLWLNLLSLVPLLISGVLVTGVLLVYHEELGAPLVIRALPERVPTAIGMALVLGVLPLHEWVHGLAIARCGHRPRYGIRWAVLFATSDGALFRRNEFVRIALAPLLWISLLGLALILLLPAGLASWIALGVAINAAGAIGDLWMTAAVLRYPASTLIRDEADSMRIFAAESPR